MSHARSPTFWRTRAWLALSAIVISVGWDTPVWMWTTSQRVAKWNLLERRGTLKGLGESLSHGSITEFITGALYAGVYAYGRVYFWLLVGIALVFAGFARSGDEQRDGSANAKLGIRSAVLVILSACAGGAFAEVCKLLARRLRPETTDGVYAFRSFLDRPWDTSGLGLASSHAGMAVAGALALGVAVPSFRVWAWLLALACCLSRIAVGAHYLSDVVVGALLGYVAFAGVYALDRSNNRGVGIESAIDSIGRGSVSVGVGEPQGAREAR